MKNSVIYVPLLLFRSYMFRCYVSPSAGSWYQSFIKTEINKKFIFIPSLLNYLLLYILMKV